MRLSEPLANAAEAAVHLRRAIPRRLMGLQECIAVLALDANLRVIGSPILVAMGTANNVEAHPRDIFREAIRRNALAIVVAHNHPTGNLKPSPQDRELAQKLDRAGEILGIRVVDHMVIGRGGHAAMSEDAW